MNKYGIDRVIIKNKEDKVYLAKLEDPEHIEALVISARICDDLDRRFGPKDFSVPEDATRRQKKKARKKEKSFRNLKPTDVNWKKFRIAVPVFFLLILIGGIVSWIIMDSRNFSLNSRFAFQGWETIRTTEGGVGLQDRQAIEENRFKNRVRGGDEFGMLESVYLRPVQSMVGTKLTEISFNVIAKQSGFARIRVGLWDNSTMTPGEEISEEYGRLLYLRSHNMKAGQARRITVTFEHTFTAVSHFLGDRFIKVTLVDWEGRLTGNDFFPLAVFNFRGVRGR